jgi:hypothetical protein
MDRDLEPFPPANRRVEDLRAMLVGAASGAVTGVVFGILFGLLLADDGISMLAVFVYWFVVGAVMGALIGLIGHLDRGGSRPPTQPIQGGN